MSAEPDARAPEPSMEEILASIRRIIADDQLAPPRPPQPPAATARAETFDFRGELASPERAWSVGAASQPPADESRADGAGQAAPTPRLATVTAAHGQIAPQFPMPDRAPAAEQGDGVQRFQASVIAPDVWGPPREPAPTRPEAVASAAVAPVEGGAAAAAARAGAPRPAAPTDLFSAQTNQAVSSAFNVLAATRLADNSEELLGLARELIRPLLKSWLDDNLPTMVERLVRAEIERVARGGR